MFGSNCPCPLLSNYHPRFPRAELDQIALLASELSSLLVRQVDKTSGTGAILHLFSGDALIFIAKQKSCLVTASIREDLSAMPQVFRMFTLLPVLVLVFVQAVLASPLLADSSLTARSRLVPKVFIIAMVSLHFSCQFAL